MLEKHTYHGEEATPVIVEEREDKLRPQLQGPFHEICHTQEELVNRHTGNGQSILEIQAKLRLVTAP